MAPSYTSSAMIVGCGCSEDVCRRGAFFNAVSCSAPTPKIEKFGQKSHEVGTGLAEGGRSSVCLRHEPSSHTWSSHWWQFGRGDKDVHKRWWHSACYYVMEDELAMCFGGPPTHEQLDGDRNAT